MRRTSPFVALTCLALMTVPVASAETVLQPAIDNVLFDLSVEDWVKSDAALVTLTVDIAGVGSGGAIRSDVLKAVGGISTKAQWRVVALNPQSDSAGLERWQVRVQARLPEDELSALSERAMKVSKPGQQVKVGLIAFDPTLAEIEVVRANLRDRIYAGVDAEVKRLNKAFPGRNYRAGEINFTEQSTAKSNNEKFVVAAPPIVARALPGVQEHLVMEARVTLSAFATP